MHSREQVADVTGRLAREFEGVLAPGSVLRCVARCREELVRAGVRDGLEPALEAMAGLRLRHRASGQPYPVGAGDRELVRSR